MRVRDHIVLSTAGSALLARPFGRGVLGLWAGAVLIDVDHYLWFCVCERRLDPRAAMRLFSGVDAPRHSAARALHSPAALLAALLVSSRRPGFLFVPAGMGLHLLLDLFHEQRMSVARLAALQRDGFRCQSCGTHGSGIGTHLWRQPPLLPSYGTHDLVSLCGPCHELAHTTASGPWS